MYHKIISALIAVSMSVPLLSLPAASAQPENNSVSGYISASEGSLVLADKNKSPNIHIDSGDYESVIRAAGDLANDIKSVTGKTPDVSSDSITAASNETLGFTINGNSMTVTLSEPVSADAQCYAASYDKNGALTAAVKGSSVSGSNGNAKFEFEKALSKPSGGKLKAFVWSKDMEPLTSAMSPVLGIADLSGTDIVIGTLGTGGAIDFLAQSGDLDVSEIEGKWESFTVQNIQNTLVIAGSDKRGTIYGIYDLSEKIGVSPWQWWADAEPQKAEALYANLPDGGYTEGEPSVKYRGIFTNDEYNLNQWSASIGSGNMNTQTYEKIFELILRLKANLMWPAMHNYSPAFHNNAENAKAADKYGVIMGSSHAEPLLRNNLGELDAFQDKWEAENPDKTLYKALENESKKKVAYYWTDHDNNNNHVDNKEFLEAYWRESVQINGGYDNIYTLGMRGVHDGSFQTNMDYPTALNEIISVQRKIIKEEVCDKTGVSITDIPQVFIPYKDVLQYYNNGSLNIPDDVTIMWTDDNYGYMRQNANDAERARAGRAGVYYHVSYYGYPTSYLWLSSTQPGLIREELTKSYDMGADKMWILNVGDLKPAEKEIEYFAKLARNIDETRNTDISSIYSHNAQRDFNMNSSDAAEYAEIMDEFYELANSKRPEFLRGGEFSLTAYGDEGQRYLDRYNAIVSRSEKLYESLPEGKKASFYELVLYPIRSARNMAASYIQTDRAKLYQTQGRGAIINSIASEANTAAAQIDTDTAFYNSMLDSKWDKIMNINPSKLQSCDAHITTNLNPPTVTALDYTQIGIDVNGHGNSDTLTLSKYDMYNKYIDIYNSGYGSFNYEITSSSPAVELSKTSGTVYGNERIFVKANPSKAESGVSDAVITITHKIDTSIVDTHEIAVTINNPAYISEEKTYAESDSTVSIEAEHFTNAVSRNGYEWKIEKDFGRSGDSLKVYPNLSNDVNQAEIASKSAYTEYSVYFENSGEYTLNAYRMPTLNERGTMRFAIGVDDGTPVMLSGTNTYPSSSSVTRDKTAPWSKGVLNNTEIISSKITVPNAGLHKIKLYNVSSGVVIDKIVLTKGAAPYSYFGAPESYNTTFNSKIPSLPQTKADTEISGITKIYEPKILVGQVNKAGEQISSVNLINLTGEAVNAVAAVSAYNAQGNMTAVNFAKATLSSGQTNVPLSITLPEGTSGYAVTVFDSFANLQPIAPYKEFGTIVSEADENGIAIKANLENYIGKKSITLIADCEITEDITADNIKYLRGEAVTKDSYKKIPFNAQQGTYHIRTGIDKESALDETKSTVINILPDNDGITKTLNTWSFDSSLNDNTGSNPFTVTGGASLSSGSISLNSASAGGASMQYSQPVTASQGGKLTVEFDIYYGRQDKKSTAYTISDSSGNILAEISLCAYNPATNASVKICGTEVLTDSTKLSNAVSHSKNTPSENGATHFKNVFDFESGRAYITVSSSKGTAEFSGKLSDADGSIKTISFTSGQTYADRASLVDNVSVSYQSAPQYAISVTAVNAADKSTVSSASITVSDAVTQSEILPDSNGKYMLCEGNYIITAAANGFRSIQKPLELTPALESKEIVLEMTSDSDLEKASITIKYVDEENNELKSHVISDGTHYVGDSYTVPSDLTKDFTEGNAQGKVNLYKFNPSRSQTSGTLLADAVFTLVFNLSAQYDYYEDFDNYTVDSSAWKLQSGTTLLPSADKGYLSYTGGSSSTGSYTNIDEINCEGKAVKIEADIYFGPKTITGDSQLSIGSTNPTFSSGKINYGVENASGHILTFIHKSNTSAFLVNNKSVSTALIGDWAHIEADVDFAAKKVNVKLTNNNGYEATVENADFYSSSTDDNIGSLYLRGAGGNGEVRIDNLKITITGEGAPPEPTALTGKTVYAFGDSIVYGHNDSNNAFMNLISSQHGMKLTKYAVNGATVVDSDNDIMKQISSASNVSPDFVVFDGYTNDAYGDPASDSFNSGSNPSPDITKILGEPQGTDANTFDSTTFCGAFEEILYTMKNKWPDTKIVFVTIHKSGARNFDIQTTLHDLTVQMCRDWDIEVVDMFTDTTLDTRDSSQMSKYMISQKGSHPNVACCEEFYIPHITQKLISLCEQ